MCVLLFIALNSSMYRALSSGMYIAEYVRSCGSEKSSTKLGLVKTYSTRCFSGHGCIRDIACVMKFLKAYVR